MERVYCTTNKNEKIRFKSTRPLKEKKRNQQT